MTNNRFDAGPALDTAPALSLLEALVRCESPSSDPQAVLRALQCYQEALEGVGVRTRWLEGSGAPWTPEAGSPPILLGDVGPEGGAPLLVVGHLDTVHPHGTLEDGLPLAYQGDGDEARLYGPGVYDMKGGLALIWGALHLLHQAQVPFSRPVRLLVTPDEEIGSDLSRALLEAEGRKARAALIPEPPLPGGHAKIRRKGVGSYRVDIHGVPAHAGIEPEKGASAIHALQDLLPALLALADPAQGTTLNVGQLHGGTADNVVASHCHFTVDVRMDRSAEAQRVDAGIRQLAVSDPRIRIDVSGGINRPPMEPSEATTALLLQVQAEAEALGFPDFQGGGTGGASDGNLLAAVGCPVIDGLGPDGSGAHTLHEHILLENVVWRIRFYTRLLQCL